MTAPLFCSDLDHRSLSRYLVQAGIFYAKEILKVDYERWRARRIQEIREKGKKANQEEVNTKDNVEDSG